MANETVVVVVEVLLVVSAAQDHPLTIKEMICFTNKKKENTSKKLVFTSFFLS
jgi:hypothetical protein